MVNFKSILLLKWLVSHLLSFVSILLLSQAVSDFVNFSLSANSVFSEIGLLLSGVLFTLSKAAIILKSLRLSNPVPPFFTPTIPLIFTASTLSA